MSNLWRSLDLPLINCEIEIDLTWSKYWVIYEISRTPEVGGANPADTTITTKATCQMNNAKLYATVVILSINHNIKFLEIIKQGFNRNIS